MDKLYTLKKYDSLTELINPLNVIIKNYDELFELLNNSTYFLPSYDIYSSKNILNELNTNINTLKNNIIPRKKFGFKNKQNILKNLDNKLITSDDIIKKIELHNISDKINDHK